MEYVFYFTFKIALPALLVSNISKVQQHQVDNLMMKKMNPFMKLRPFEYQANVEMTRCE